MDNTNYLRKSLHDRLGIYSDEQRTADQVSIEIHFMVTSLEAIVELARPCLIMGGLRYGSNWTHEKLMNYMQEKFNKYKETGNFELLVDFFNFVAVEGELKTHPNYHFNSLDRK